MRFELTHHLSVPIEKAFAYATDFRKAPERVQSIMALEVLTHGPIGVGTRFRETRMMFKREATETMEITAFDPPNSYQTDADSHGCRYRSELNFAAAGDGTDVTIVFHAEPYTFMAKVMGFIFRPMMKRCLGEIAKDLDDLAKAIEAE